MIGKPEGIIVKVFKGLVLGNSTCEQVNAAESSGKIKTRKITLHLSVWSSLVTFLKVVWVEWYG